MHLKSLRVFCDVVGRRSFSRAADDNGMTQSGASQIVHHLEEYLGVKLIDRSKRPFVLTPEGRVFYEGCRGLVQKLYALEEEVRTLHQEVEGRVTVASIYSAGLSHVNRCVKDFLSLHPKAKVRVEFQHPQRVYELVESNQVDMGLVSYPKASRTIKATAWRDEPMMLVCAPHHDLATRRSVALTELDGLDMVGFDPELRIRREVDKVLAEHGVNVRVAMEFDNIETLKRAVEINSGVSLLPQPTVRREVELGSLIAIPLSDIKLVRPLGIIHRCEADLGATARHFIQFLLDPSSRPASDETTCRQTVEEPSPATAHDRADKRRPPSPAGQGTI
jgi:DNA-binding transcriptional LysR family regulator